MENITDRIGKLERQMQKSRRLNFLLLGGIMLVGLYGFGKRQALEDLKVKSISIVDEQGNIYAKMATSTAGGWLNVYNNAGKAVAGIYTESDGDGGTWLAEKSGFTRQTTFVDADGGGSYYYNSYGKIAASVFNNSNGFGVVRTYDHSGKQMSSLAGTTDAGGSLSLSNTDNKYTAFIGGYSGSLMLYDNQGETKVYLGAKNDHGNGFLNLANSQGKRVIYLGAGNYDKKGYLYTYDGYNTTGTFPK